MPDYLFSYAYVIDGRWHFDYLVYELPRFDDKALRRAQKDAARRHDKPEKIAGALIVPMAVSKLDAGMKIRKVKKDGD